MPIEAGSGPAAPTNGAAEAVASWAASVRAVALGGAAPPVVDSTVPVAAPAESCAPGVARPLGVDRAEERPPAEDDAGDEAGEDQQHEHVDQRGPPAAPVPRAPSAAAVVVGVPGEVGGEPVVVVLVVRVLVVVVLVVVV